MKKLVSTGALALVVLMGVIMSGCYEDDSLILDAALRCRITRDYYNQMIKPNYPDISLEKLKIEKEYGVFEGHVVVRFNPVLLVGGLIVPIDIGGVVIDWAFAYRIIAWKDGHVFTLITAQENNLLSQASLREIALIDNTLFECGKVPDPGGNFVYNCVVVLLTEEATLIDKVWAPSDFPEFAFSEIRNGGLIGTQRFLVFYLTEPSRDNVLRAVCKLSARTEVYIAELTGIETFLGL
jgi:hypothetical protein